MVSTGNAMSPSKTTRWRRLGSSMFAIQSVLSPREVYGISLYLGRTLHPLCNAQVAPSAFSSLENFEQWFAKSSVVITAVRPTAKTSYESCMSHHHLHYDLIQISKRRRS